MPIPPANDLPQLLTELHSTGLTTETCWATLISVSTFSERVLLRRIRKFMPVDANVLAIDVALCNPLGSMRQTPIVLTDTTLLLVTSVRATTVVTSIPFEDVVGTRGGDGLISIGFRDLAQDANRLVTLDFRRHRDRDGFIEKMLASMRPWLEPRQPDS